MPPAARSRGPFSTLRRGCLALAVLLASGLGASLAAASPRAAAAGSERGSTLTLAGQTSWVRGPSGLTLQLRIKSPLPVARLGLKFVLYSRLTSRSDFAASLTGTEPPSELPVDTPAVVPLGLVDQRSTADGAVTVHFPVETSPTLPTRSASSPPLDLACGTQCAGVYPLEAALVDESNGTLLASFTTHLVYTVGTGGTLPLNVALVLPIGSASALGPTGAPELDTTRIEELQRTLEVVAAHPGVKVTFELYPQLLVALERDPSRLARDVLAELESAAGRSAGAPATAGREFLGTTFADVDPNALVASGLVDELAAQLGRGAAALGPLRSGASTPYVANGGLGGGALAALEAAGIHDFVVPTGDVSTPAGETVPTVALTSPFRLLPPGGGPASPTSPVALAADPALAAHLDAHPDDPVLGAHQLLADLAEIYFDAPDDVDPRGVVVAPASWTWSATSLGAVLAGLADSPVVSSLTLDGALALPVGGNQSPPTEQLLGGAPRAAAALSSGAVQRARHELAVVSTVVPDAHAELARLGDSVLLGESAGLSRAARARYNGAPEGELAAIRASLSITGGRSITLTARTGRVPLNFVSTARYPVHGTIVLRGTGNVTFAGASSGSRAVPIVLAPGTTARDYTVSTLSSGVSRLDVEVVSPVGGAVLLETSVKLSSTAASGVAVALSIGALLVLGAWWTRSVLRHRRRAALERAASAADAAGT